MTPTEALILSLEEKIQNLTHKLRTRQDLTGPQRRAIMEQIAENRDRRAKASRAT